MSVDCYMEFPVQKINFILLYIISIILRTTRVIQLLIFSALPFAHVIVRLL